MLAYVFLLALFAPALISAQTQGIRPCTGGRPFVSQLRVENCTATPCDIFQGSDAVMEADFRALFPASGLRPQVFATALGATIEYNLPPAFANGCNHLAIGSCPLSANEDITYRFVFTVTPFYPPIPVSVELTLFDQGTQAMFCAVIDIHVRLR